MSLTSVNGIGVVLLCSDIALQLYCCAVTEEVHSVSYTSTIKKVIVIILLIALAIGVLYILKPQKDKTKVYDIGYIFYDYENNTDYINRTAPFINVGGRIYYLAKEDFYGGALVNACQIISYIDYETGIPYSVCESDQCIHNNVYYTKNCPLAYFRSDLVIDDQGWIYGVYQPGKLVSDVLQEPDNTMSVGLPELGRYNLYIQQYQTLYAHQPDHTDLHRRDIESITNICTSDRYVYFFEMQREAGTGRRYTYLSRYDKETNITVQLAEETNPLSIFVFGDSIYTLEAEGLYRSDLDYSDESRTLMLDLNSGFFEETHYISNLQYDSFTEMIYFLKHDTSGTKLCRVKGYDTSDTGVIDRRPYEVKHPGSIYEYQLTYDRIYYTLAEKRYIGDIVSEVLGEGELVYSPHYASTDGKLYSITYTEVLSDDAIEPAVVWDDTSLYFKNQTVIGNYMYAELFTEVGSGMFYNDMKTDYRPTEQIRVDLVTGRVDKLVLSNWELLIVDDR